MAAASPDQPRGVDLSGAQESIRLSAADAEQPEWVLDNARRTDPAVDQWPSEVLHDKAKKVLVALVKRACGAEPWEAAEVAKLLAPSFRGATEIRPRELALAFDDGSARVWRPKGVLTQELSGAGEFEAVIGRLMAPFEGKKSNYFAKIVRVHLDEGARFRTEALVHLDGKGQGGLFQVNMEWELEWVVTDEASHAVAIDAIRVTHYDEAATKVPLYADVAAAAFADCAAYEQEFLHGIEDYAGRTDRLIGAPYLGMQGLAVGDVNGDGLDDLYVPQQAGLPNRLFLHRPDGTLEDVTQASRTGVLETTRSALIVDHDNDGDQDLLLALGPALLVMKNDGKGVFGESQLHKAGSPGDIYSLSAADADQDGDLDVYACRYATNGVLFSVPTPYHDATNGNPNVYYRNDGDTFTIATDEVGLGENNTRFSLASVWEDFDLDGDPDLFVANDFGRDSYYRNEGGRFDEIGAETGADDIAAGMGVSVGDYDQDGDFDLYITNMFSSAGQRIVPQQEFMGGKNEEVHGFYESHARGNTLLANRGDGTFEDRTEAADVAVGGWGWGAMFVDFNNDGREDLFSPDGFLTNDKPDDL
ncbi:MAG: VCBS repeat-containing protein [Planctomycetota bacterium]